VLVDDALVELEFARALGLQASTNGRWSARFRSRCNLFKFGATNEQAIWENCGYLNIVNVSVAVDATTRRIWISGDTGEITDTLVAPPMHDAE